MLSMTERAHRSGMDVSTAFIGTHKKKSLDARGLLGQTDVSREEPA
jgi:hypothetical protein